MPLKFNIIDGSNEPWSLNGWTIIYKQIGPESFAYKWKSPDDVTYRNSGSSDGWFIYRGAKDMNELLQCLEGTFGLRDAMERYLIRTANEKMFTI